MPRFQERRLCQTDGVDSANRRFCTICRKFGHKDAYCLVNPANRKNLLPRQDGKPTVGVYIVSAYEQVGDSGRSRNSQPRGCHYNSLGQEDSCYLCKDLNHQMRICALNLRFLQFVASEKQRANTVGVNSVEVEELDDRKVAVTLTRAARVKTGLSLADKEVKEPEQRQHETETDWELKELIQKELIAFTKGFNKENELARLVTAYLEANAPAGPSFDGGWVGFTDSDFLQDILDKALAATTKDHAQPQPQAFAKEPSRQVLETPITAL